MFPASRLDVFLDYAIQVAGQVQEVEVDQRALVNILSRYPGAFDVLRELIQNADDAEAGSIELYFQTGEAEESPRASEFDVSQVNVYKWIIKNDGKAFEEKDWKRLGKIADGNDNSTKVGAFGVGFYSVLSKSDQPLVRSNGNDVFSIMIYRRLRKQFTHCDPDSWTSVELKLKAPEPLPVLADLARFLVSSVAFLTNIHTISVYLDSQSVLHIQKQVQPPVDILIPQHLKPTTPLHALKVESIQRTVQKIAIDAAEWAFASSSTSTSSLVVTDDTLVERSGRYGEDYPTHLSRNADAILKDKAITHDLYTATTRVILHPDSKIKKGVESSMKSLPPSFKCKAVYFNSEQSLTGINNLDSSKAKHLARLFCGSQGIFPENDRHVPRFIIRRMLTSRHQWSPVHSKCSLPRYGHDSTFHIQGQSTNQTTGIGLHISAHFLPTMEHSCLMLSIAWNKEVLRVGGFLARIIYEEEMRIAAKSREEHATQLGLCTMSRFAFRPTVPHSGVSQILQDSFFSCCHEPKSPFPVVSDVGISCASDSYFRQSNKDLSFLKRYLALHRDVESNIHSQIIRRYKIPLFKFGDIVREFEAGVTQEAMRSFFVWWEDARRNAPSSPSSRDAREKFCKEFALRGILRSSDGVKIYFKNIKFFSFFSLPNDLSPPNTIHIDVTMSVPTRGAIECFGWTQLPLLYWLQYACSQARGSGQVSDVGHRISRALVQFALVEDLSLQQWNQAAELMRDLACIPTNTGLKLPADSYFDEADVCGSLPVAKEADFLNIPPTPVAVERGFEHRFVEPDHVRKVLVRIRVCRMMDWDNMVERLEIVASEDSNYRLLVYLAIVLMGRLMDRQIGDLRKKKVFYSKNHGRVSATELLLPNEDMLKLGLPILALPRNGIASLQNVIDPSGSFVVDQFIEFLGIQRYPTLEKIITLAASDKPEVQRSALQYLLSNLETRYNAYTPDKFANVAFIPTKNGSLARLNEVFASPIWEKLGFKHVSEASRRDLLRLGVKDDPSVDTIIECFKTSGRRPSDIDSAKIWFELLYQHGKLPSSKLREDLSKIPFVPVKSSNPSSELAPIDTISDIFPFVDFGQNGNSFLDSCCAKKSPDASDIARRILQDPRSYLEALRNDIDLYLEDLRTIASRLDLISEEDKQAMQKTAMFLAFRNGVASDKLLTAEQVLISDWESRDFDGNVFVAPENDTLQKMYREMGSVFLGTYVRHDLSPPDYKAEYNTPFNHDEVIRRTKCFMDQRDKCEKTGVSFYGQGATSILRVRACKSLTLKRTFAPPYGVLADAVTTETVEIVSDQIKAGIKFDEDDESYTLWMVKGNESVDLRNDIAVALCHVLLKTYGRNDVLLLASLFAMGDESLTRYYGSEIKCELPTAPDPKEKSKNKVKVELSLPLFLAKAFGVPQTMRSRIIRKKFISAEDGKNIVALFSGALLMFLLGARIAIALLGGSDPNCGVEDFSAQSLPHGSKKKNNKCKQVHALMLEKKKDLRDEGTQIEFFLARNAKCQQPPKRALKEFAELVSNLARVFTEKEASAACSIFWDDRDEDLMAFNRDQKLIYLNLAHYYKFREYLPCYALSYSRYLIMAHEIAHNATMNHDEEHGSISARIAIKYLPALHKRFPYLAESVPKS
ncbi:hypothetical protein J3R83DRAFT_14027 [Lanmaoa asiatica]|nr:hypothetical protein J3R83DRAFT_14027 [Lanmaoa asiatica]